MKVDLEAATDTFGYIHRNLQMTFNSTYVNTITLSHVNSGRGQVAWAVMLLLKAHRDTVHAEREEAKNDIRN